MSSALEGMLASKYYTMQLLPSDTRSQIFVPLIETLDSLLVSGAVHGEADYKRILALLDPESFASKEKRSELLTDICLLLEMLS